MPRVHHATAKLAAKHGMTITYTGTHYDVHQGDALLATGSTAKDTLAKAIELSNPAKAPRKQRVKANGAPKAKPAKRARKQVDVEEGDEDEAEDGQDEGASVVKSKYKQTYRGNPTKVTCADPMRSKLAQVIKVKDADTGKMVTDLGKLKALARANGVWQPGYGNLNVGMVSMNVGNRLRKLERDGAKINWVVR